MTIRLCMFRWLLSLIAVALLSPAGQTAFAQDAPAAVAPAGEASVPLATSQEAIRARYLRFENTLQQLSEYLRKADPQRADLLVRAIGKSKEGRIPDQLGALTELLKNDQLGDAIEREEDVIKQMQVMLDLLMSEDRKDEIEQEKARIKDLIKDVDRLIGKQTDARANTERGGDPDDLQSQQKKVADGTEKLVQKIEGQDALKNAAKQRDKEGKPKDANAKPKNPSDKRDPKDGELKDGDAKDKDGKPTDGKDAKPGDDKDGKSDPKDPKDGKPKDAKPGEPKDGKPSDPKDAKPSDPKDGQPSDSQGKPKDSQPQDGKPQKGQQGEPQDMPPQDGDSPKDQDSPDQQDQNGDEPKPDKTPGREEVQKAKQEMDRAIEELKKNRKAKASDKQDQALAELLKAKEKLEEILRQLREEERAMVLAALEARFRDMLLRQEAVNNGTLAIHAVPINKRSDRHRNRAVELARNEDEISLLAAKALTLLKEEGSSVAFPEAVEQIRDDMLTVARRLERADVAEITQNIEADIVESLKEILEAMQKELEKLKDEKQKQQQQQQQEKKPEPLVNKLAELKMLRSLQYRVNRRTKQMGRLVEGEQALDGDVVSQLRQLSERQAKVQKATHDLATGKNE